MTTLGIEWYIKQMKNEMGSVLKIKVRVFYEWNEQLVNISFTVYSATTESMSKTWGSLGGLNWSNDLNLNKEI